MKQAIIIFPAISKLIILFICIRIIFIDKLNGTVKRKLHLSLFMTKYIEFDKPIRKIEFKSTDCNTIVN